MKKIIAFVSIILIFNTGLSQRISSNDLDHFLKVDNSVYEKEILKKGFVFDTINEYTNNGKLYYFKKFENEKTGEWIERFFWDKSKVQINYTTFIRKFFSLSNNPSAPPMNRGLI